MYHAACKVEFQPFKQVVFTADVFFFKSWRFSTFYESRLGIRLDLADISSKTLNLQLNEFTLAQDNNQINKFHLRNPIYTRYSYTFTLCAYQKNSVVLHWSTSYYCTYHTKILQASFTTAMYIQYVSYQWDTKNTYLFHTAYLVHVTVYRLQIILTAKSALTWPVV